MICPHCKEKINDKIVSHYLAAKGGKAKSKAKISTAQENGKKGGRPKKTNLTNSDEFS